MLRLYTETNALESDVGEKLNTYFVDPVSKADYPDYFAIIKRPICMKQIKRKIDKDATYTLQQFRSDMHTLWDNARTYNQEGSWVHNAAEDMQEYFDKAWTEQVDAASTAAPSLGAGAAGGLESAGGSGSGVNSGTSTPMYKPLDSKPAGIGKIKLNMGGGGASRRTEIFPDEDEEGDEDGGDGGEEESEASESDDDY